MTDRIIVNSDHLWVMLLSTIRYSLGRMTYMSTLAPDLVRVYGKALTNAQLLQVREEVALSIAAEVGQKVGMDCDDRSWRRFVEDLDGMILARRRPASDL